eukprot:355550-Chlamydomonas_euryale.AAC.6
MSSGPYLNVEIGRLTKLIDNSASQPYNHVVRPSLHGRFHTQSCRVHIQHVWSLAVGCCPAYCSPIPTLLGVSHTQAYTQVVSAPRNSLDSAPVAVPGENGEAAAPLLGEASVDA